ncbi:MAG: enoyl-CoA hydratase/isomerase family protein, partial [Pseudomonadota bacterium]
MLIRREGAVGFLSLDRPQALHALTLDMVHAMTGALAGWIADPAVEAVVIDHAEGRGFCAGGDIAFLRNSALNDGGVSGRRFFHDEYRLNHLLFSCPKPVIAFIDGVTMGGGVGLSQPAKFRVATENTRFAMPETGIGLFPDVGGTWLLSRAPGEVGAYLVLTGARMTGADAILAGFADTFVEAGRLSALADMLAVAGTVDQTIAKFTTTPPASAIASLRQEIDATFGGEDVRAILRELAAKIAKIEKTANWAAKA